VGGKVSSQKLDDAAKRGTLGDAYLYYKVLSGDAAHPSVSAMNRYVQLGQYRLTGIRYGPFPDEVLGFAQLWLPSDDRSRGCYYRDVQRREAQQGIRRAR
jgi:hypothetical protein